jgi:D-alanyl-D-alanine carboxypeptidase
MTQRTSGMNSGRQRARAVGLVVALCGFAGVTGGVVAHADASSTLRGDMRKLVHEGVPGVTVLVRDEDGTKITSAGSASLKPKIAMSKNERFRIGSTTKPMVATVVLQLVDEGKLSLDQPITEIVGDLAGGDERITVRDLLAHKSGISDYLDDPRPIAPYLKGKFDHVWTPEQLIGFALDHPTLFEPGTDSAYSNTNYTLLGLIIEKVTGNSLGTELRTRVFEPLGMDDSSLATGTRIRGPHASGYLVGEGGELQDVTGVSPSFYWGAGNVISTTRDIADFFDGLLEGDLLPPELLAEMTTFEPMSPGSDYGLGVEQVSLPCGSGIGHGGAVPGYKTAALNMDNGITLVAVANSLTMDDKVGTNAAQDQWNHLLTKAACGGYDKPGTTSAPESVGELLGSLDLSSARLAS